MAYVTLEYIDRLSFTVCVRQQQIRKTSSRRTSHRQLFDVVREVAPPPRQRCRDDRRPNSASTGCQSVRDVHRTTTKRAGTTTSRSLVGDNNDDDDIAWSARDGLLSCGMDVTTARYHVDAASGPYRGLDRRRSVFRSSAWVAAVVRENGRQSAAAAGRGAAAPPTNHSAPSVHRPSPAAFEVLIFARNDVIEKIALDGGIRRNRNEPRRCYCWAECFRSRCVLQARKQRRVIRSN